MSIFGKISNIIRINFIGRPLELNRLAYDDSCLVETKDEANFVIKAYWKYYGYQYFGNLISFGLQVHLKPCASPNLASNWPPSSLNHIWLM